MQVETFVRGTLEQTAVTSAGVYGFEPHLAGFPGLRRFAIIPDEQGAFEWLQSVDAASVAFPLLDPFGFCPNYALSLFDDEVAALGVEVPGDLFVRCIVTVRPSSSELTASLLAPLVFCRRTHLARQVILQDSGQELRYRVDARRPLRAVA